MYTEMAFKSEISNLLPPEHNTTVHKEACWRVYNNASRPDNRRLIAGLLDDLDIALEKLGRTSIHQTGGVLRSSAWSIILNDSWILGGIHGHVNFELISLPSEDSVINKSYSSTDSVDRIFRVTGRELIGLTSFGYAQVCGPVEKISADIRPAHLPNCNALIQCVNPGLADSATFTAYQDVILRKASLAVANGWQVIDGLMI